MAVILRSGTARTTETTNSFVRKTTVHVAQTGLIQRITSQNGMNLAAVDLGHMGDHNTTRVAVKMWDGYNYSSSFAPALVMYNKHNYSVTLPMFVSGNEYCVDIPSKITSVDGQYQIFFILQEKILPTEEDNVAIGEADDPAYREVFISAGFVGLVVNDSGYEFVKELTNNINFWNDGIYNYNIGGFRIYNRASWSQSAEADGTPYYSVSITLGGLQNSITTCVFGTRDISAEEQIVISLPSGISERHANISNKTLIFSVYSTLEDEALSDALDDIEVRYPVVFSVNEAVTGGIQKTPIKVQYTPNSIAVIDNENLGMKMDAYVTPIDVSDLQNIAVSTALRVMKRYVVFKKSTELYVCEAFNNKCWIPIGVTSQPGLWSVSFIGRAVEVDADGNEKIQTDEKGDQYLNQEIYYTKVLQLPVVDNALVGEDLLADTVAMKLETTDLEYLVDENGLAVYSTATTSGSYTLGYSGSEINSSIGWVQGIKTSYSSAGVSEYLGWVENILVDNEYSSTKTVNTLNKVEKIETDLENLKTKVDNSDVANLEARLSSVETNTTTNTKDISNLKSKDSELEKQITTTQENVTTLTNTVNGLSNIPNDIKLIKQDIADLENDVADNKSDIKNLNATVADHSSNISGLKAQDDNLNMRINGLGEDISKINTNSTLLNERIDREIAERAERDTQLTTAIQNEQSRAQAAEELLQSQINDINNDINDINNNINDINTNSITNLQAQITENKNAIDNERTSRQQEDDNLNERISTMNTAIASLGTRASQTETLLGLTQDEGGKTVPASFIRNDYNNEVPENTTYISKIVFLSSEDEYNSIVEKEAHTLYLIKEEQ